MANCCLSSCAQQRDLRQRSETADSDNDSDDDMALLDVVGLYPTERQRKLALGGILAFEFFRNMAIQAVSVWIPVTLSLNVYFFNSGNGKIDIDKHNIVKFQIGMVSVFSNVLIYGLGWIVGIITDACIKKTRILFATSLLMYAGFIYLSMILYDVSNNIDCITPANSSEDLSRVNCTVTPTQTAGDSQMLITIYTFLTAALSALESVFVTVLPVLGGDQIPDIRTVRRFYALYYWFRKLGEVMSGLVCVTFVVFVPHFFFDRNNFDGFYVFLLRGWFGFVFTTSTLGTLFMMLVFFSKITREPRSDLSVITDTAGIWKQGCLRSRQRVEEGDCLDMAKRSRGGTYPDQAVDERKNMALFFCAVLCLLPTGFTTKLPVGSVPADRHIAAYPLSHINVSANAYLYTEWIHCQTHIFCKLGGFISSALVIPLVHYTCIYLKRRFNVYVKFLHRLTAGQITMIISAALYMITTHGYNYEISLRVLLAPSVFLGISNALVYAVVYEMNLVISPRSMQCTSMGMFRFLDGAGSLINLIAAYASYASNIDYFLGSGIASIVIGMTLIIILEKKVGVGLTRV